MRRSRMPRPGLGHKRQQAEWRELCRGAGIQFAKLVARLKITPEQLAALKAKREEASP